MFEMMAINAALRAHPKLLWIGTFAASVLAGALMSLFLSVSAGCGPVPQQIASAVAVVGVAADRGVVVWWDEQAKEAEEQVEQSGGTIDDWCAAVAKPHQVAQRVECAAVAVMDLALAGQAIIDTASGDDVEWQEWLAGVPPLIAALQSSFEAAGYDPPAALSRALSALRALLGGGAPGDEATIECEVTEMPAECLARGAP